MQVVEFDEFLDMLRLIPVMAELDYSSLAFLPEEVKIFENPLEMIAELDSPELQDVKPMLVTKIEPSLQHRLPSVRCNHNPFTTKLNKFILKKYEFIKSHMCCQSMISSEIIRGLNTDAVALMLIDGLGWADLQNMGIDYDYNLTPVLVDGVSITEHGMKRIIGNPPLVQRIFDLGVRKLLGFSYWKRDEEPLTDYIFRGFGDAVYKVKSFEEVINVLENSDLKNCFVQIVRAGLDNFAHHQRERPNINSAIEDILDDFKKLINIFKKKRISAQIHLTSDHGILWAHKHSLQTYEFSGAEHPRYYEYLKSSEHTLNVDFEGKEFSLLEYPYLRRKLKSNEWGVHGGLSFEESIVPWISVRVRGG